MVVSPTSKRAISKQRAGVVASDRDLLISPDAAAFGADLVGLTGGLTGPTTACHKGIGTSPPAAELSKHQRLRAWLVGLCPCGVLDLCRIVLPPTSEGSIIKVCACKSPSSSKSLGGSAYSEIYGVGVGGAAVCGVAVAELAGWLYPQHLTVLLSNIAQVWAAPAMDLALRPVPKLIGLASGAWRRVRVSP